MPHFCIVIPSSDAAQTIEDAIRSAVSQDYDDYSVVVSDNASADGTIECLQRFGNHPRLAIHRHTERLGKTANWNRAFRLAGDCEYLVNLHADDRLEPHCLTTLARRTRRKPALAHGAIRSIFFNGTPKSKRRHFAWPYVVPQGPGLQMLLMLGNLVSVVGTAISRRAFEAVGGWPEEYTFMQDVELWSRLSRLGETYYIPAVLGDYRDQQRQGVNLNYLAELISWHLRCAECDEGAFMGWCAQAGLRKTVKDITQSIEAKLLRNHKAVWDNYTAAVKHLGSHGGIYVDPVWIQRTLRLQYCARYLGKKLNGPRHKMRN